MARQVRKELVFVMGRQLQPDALDLSGQRFGMLKVTRPVYVNRRAHWLCRCDCGADTVTQSCSLTDGRTKSCGCAQGGQHRHRDYGSRTYRSWHSMHQRCTNPKAPGYNHYGGRGITVCERWRDYANFLADMGQRPPGMTLDRIDSNGNYEPENCRWSTTKEQTRNRRNNRLLTYGGRTMPAVCWAEEVGITKNAMYSRLRYMSDEEAITLKPVKGANQWTKLRKG